MLRAAQVAWTPPEVLTAEAVPSEATDVYAFGVILYEFLATEIPYKGKTQDAIPLLVLRGTRPSSLVDMEPILQCEALRGDPEQIKDPGESPASRRRGEPHCGVRKV